MPIAIGPLVAVVVDAALLNACIHDRNVAAEPAPVFDEIASTVGLDFLHVNGMAGEYYFVEIMGSGAALFDYDADGDLDLYLVQGHPLRRRRTADPPQISIAAPRDRLFHNELHETGALAFTDVTGSSGMEARGYGMGTATGDYDNDGCVDLYVLNWGANQLWRNRCNETFEDVTLRAGVADEGWSVAASFFDYDRDGWLDLYVVNYKSYDLTLDRECFDRERQRSYCGPLHYESAADRLFRNRGDGTFVDVTELSGMGGVARAGLGVVAADLDGDGWIDLYVANDQEPNILWRNRGDGTFEDVATLSGTAFDGHGRALASMGVDAADYDDDGDLDLFMTHLDGEPNVLYRNLGDGLFEDVSARSGIGQPSSQSTGFGTRFFDYDNDGKLDLFVANGAVEVLPELRRRGDPFPLHQPNQLFRNLGDGQLVEIANEAQPVLQLSEVSRGAAFGDVDNDGDTDIVVTNNAGPVRLLENLVGSHAAWLGLRLVTGDPPRPALGTRVRVDLDGGTRAIWRRVGSDGSYGSASDPRILLGLGGVQRVERIEVEWADGLREIFPPPPLRRYSTLRQGFSVPLVDSEPIEGAGPGGRAGHG